MKRIVFFILSFICCIVCNAYGPDQILSDAVQKIKGNPATSCKFTASGSEGSIRGDLLSDGARFNLQTQAGSTWYDGKNMWTSNPRTKEITLVTPSNQELAQVNPLAYLDGYKNIYNVYFSKRKDASDHLIVLNPKSKNGEIKAIEIGVSKKTLLPTHIYIRDRQDKLTRIEINTIKTGIKTDVSKYTCPVESMSGFEVIDLR